MKSQAESSTVDPIIPLTLLQAVRGVDWPQGIMEAEYVPELLNKRLGTTDTVYAQIKRYNDAVKRKQNIPAAEVIGLARLIGRRPDASDVFREAGAATARAAYGTLGIFSRAMVHGMPKFIARPIAKRKAKKIVRRYFHAKLERYGSDFRMRLLDSRVITARMQNISASATIEDTAASYYDAGLQELLSLLALN